MVNSHPASTLYSQRTHKPGIPLKPKFISSFDQNQPLVFCLRLKTLRQEIATKVCKDIHNRLPITLWPYFPPLSPVIAPFILFGHIGFRANSRPPGIHSSQGFAWNAFKPFGIFLKCHSEAFLSNSHLTTYTHFLPPLLPWLLTMALHRLLSY